jgi:hypothetical protein
VVVLQPVFFSNREYHSGDHPSGQSSMENCQSSGDRGLIPLLTSIVPNDVLTKFDFCVLEVVRRSSESATATTWQSFDHRWSLQYVDSKLSGKSAPTISVVASSSS